MRLKLTRGTITTGTVLSSIEVPALLRERIPPGIDFFDETLGGQGWTPTTATMFTGTPGAGKTTMLLMVASRLAEQGHTVIFNSNEESPYQLKLHYERLKLCGPIIVGVEESVPELLKKVRKMTVSGRKTFLFVDSLQAMDDGKFSTGRITSATLERSLEQLTSWAKETGGILCAIGHVTKSGAFAGTQKLRHIIDIKIDLMIDEKPKSPTFGLRKLVATKNRWGYAGVVTVLDVTDSGFVQVDPNELDNDEE